MKIGVIACDIMKRELDRVLRHFPEVTEVIYLESGLHIHPETLKPKIKEKIKSIKAEVDAVFLGYGFCQSLKGIEEEFDLPIVFPQVDDCISILFTPERREEEIAKEAGTWFMTPGWAEVGADMIFKELEIDRLKKLGMDPLEVAKELFTAYKQGIYIDTGVGDNDYFIGKAAEFCECFGLALNKTAASSTILEETLEKCRSLPVSSTNSSDLPGGHRLEGGRFQDNMEKVHSES